MSGKKKGLSAEARKEKEHWEKIRKEEKAAEEKRRRKEQQMLAQLEKDKLKQKQQREKELEMQMKEAEKERQKQVKQRVKEIEREQKIALQPIKPMEESDFEEVKEKKPEVREERPYKYYSGTPGVSMVPKKPKVTDAKFRFSDFIEFVYPLKKYIGPELFNLFLALCGTILFLFFVILMNY